jgi:hypothetical protein
MFWRCSVEYSSVVGRFRNVANVTLVDMLLRKVNLVVLCMLWGGKTSGCHGVPLLWFVLPRVDLSGLVGSVCASHTAMTLVGSHVASNSNIAIYTAS